MCPLSGYCRKWGGGLIGCPTQLTLVTCICQLSTNTSEKYEKTQQENLLEGGARKIAFSYFFSFIPFYFWRGSRCILAIFMRASPGNIQMWIFTQDIARLSPFLINPPEYCKIHRPMLLATKCDIVYLFMRVQNCRRGCKKIINAFVLSRWGSLFANLANYGSHFPNNSFCKFCRLSFL